MVDLESLKVRWTTEQIELRSHLQLEDPSWLLAKLNSDLFLIGGLDISFSKLHPDVAVATLAVISSDTLETHTQTVCRPRPCLTHCQSAHRLWLPDAVLAGSCVMCACSLHTPID
ncbi:hypothetical protein AHF37_05924 [Paragonimus kellicotti]|nr:hypothetical protein AHF37_05924 [Paragonimus kellicotti]